MLDRVKKALTAITPQGAFATQMACPSDDLRIEVKGVGALRFPISAATVRALCAVARPAPFGRRDKTLHDERVRDTWELGKGQIKIDVQSWKRTLEPALASVRQKLGLPADGKLVAVLDKMLVYTPGQFFAPHQDSERADDMVASLVVVLPSTSSGGAVIVHHQGEKKTFRGARSGAKALSLLAFYADCHHEVKPLASGHRVVLTYHLLHREAAKPRSQMAPSTSPAIDELAESVNAYFSTPVAHRYRDATPEQPDRLIYLLDHEYTEKGLSWSRLKNADRLRVGALRQIAERLACESYLVLADVHENWTCEDDSRGYGWHERRYRRYDDDDDNDDESSEHQLGELCDTDVELRHWVGHDGSTAPSVPVHPADSEICFTKASVEMDPFKSEHEGYMGNYGNTVDRWYHRAALVMWPRERDFVIRAKVSPSWAVTEIAARIKARGLPAARDAARSLLPFWSRCAPGDENKTFFPKVLQVALALDDAELARGLLAPFGPLRFSARALPTFAALVERSGLAWSQGVFTAWSEHDRHRTPPTLSLLPDLFDALLSGAPSHGRALAAWLLTRSVNDFRQARMDELRSPAIWLGDDKPGKHSDALLTLLEAARVIDAVSTRDDLITLLTTGDTALSSVDAAALLEACQKGRSPAAVRSLGLGALHRHVVDALEAALAAPARQVDDWSIELRMQCKCELCAVLSAFLRSRSRVEHSWPLAKERRQHVHGVIGRHGMPVTHVTTRSGSPYTLVLTKQKALFERAARARAQEKGRLEWLKKHRDAFTGGENR